MMSTAGAPATGRGHAPEISDEVDAGQAGHNPVRYPFIRMSHDAIGAWRPTQEFVNSEIKPVNRIDFAVLRNGMVERQVAARGVHSHLVLDAMRTVPREAFLPEPMREFAYEDSPLPIAEHQTISQPYIVALMTEALALEGG